MRREKEPSSWGSTVDFVTNLSRFFSLGIFSVQLALTEAIEEKGLLRRRQRKRLGWGYRVFFSFIEV